MKHYVIKDQSLIADFLRSVSKQSMDHNNYMILSVMSIYGNKFGMLGFETNKKKI